MLPTLRRKVQQPNVYNEVIVRVSSIGYRIEYDSSVVILDIGHAHPDGTSKDDAEIALSIPAAFQLSHSLKRAVKAYLRHTPNNDT